MLLEYGALTVDESWIVTEASAIGYSRVYYVYSGDVCYTDGSRKAMLKRGHLYIFPSCIPYKITHDPQKPLCCQYVHLDLFPIMVTDLVEINVDENPFLKPFFEALLPVIQERKEELVSSMTDTFVLYAVQNGFFTYPDTRIAKILLYISDHLQEDLTVKKLSELGHYNEQYFIRLFKKSVGVSPHQYIINCRLKEAIKLLKTDCSISQAARQCGYKDLKTLSRAFKERFGITPSDWRRFSKRRMID